MTATFEIDGRTFTGSTVVIRRGRLEVDQQPVDDALHGVVELRVLAGRIERLECDAPVIAQEVGFIAAMGDVTAVNVNQIEAAGSVHVIGSVAGNITGGGQVIALGGIGDPDESTAKG